MFRHVVMFRWHENVEGVSIEKAVDALSQLPIAISEVRGLSLGRDAGFREGNHDLVVIVDFEDADAYLNYASHPAHLALIRDYLQPLLAERVAVQYWMLGVS